MPEMPWVATALALLWVVTVVARSASSRAAKKREPWSVDSYVSLTKATDLAEHAMRESDRELCELLWSLPAKDRRQL